MLTLNQLELAPCKSEAVDYYKETQIGRDPVRRKGSGGLLLYSSSFGAWKLQ